MYMHIFYDPILAFLCLNIFWIGVGGRSPINGRYSLLLSPGRLSPLKFPDTPRCSPTRGGVVGAEACHTHKSYLWSLNPPWLGTHSVPPVGTGTLPLIGDQGLCEWIWTHQRQHTLSCRCGWSRALQMKGLTGLSVCGDRAAPSADVGLTFFFRKLSVS